LPLARVHVWDASPEAARAMTEELRGAVKFELRAADSLAVVAESDVVVTCTSARKAFLGPDLVRPGTFIAAVGADNSDKQEIDPRLYAASMAVVDSREPAADIGDLHHAIQAAPVTASHAHATLAEVL